MTLRLLTRVAGASGAAALVAIGTAGAALAQTTPTVDKGDAAFMFLATIIVLLMTVPGLALFYGGLVRAKNMLSILMQVFAITCMVSIIWVTYGYSMAFTPGGALNDYVGGFSKAFLSGVTPASLGATFTNGVYIPELAFVAFQMTFACITPALIVGSLAERMKFSSVMLFVALWVTFVYFPMAHMVWYWGGPDVMAEAAKAGGAALEAASADAGLLFKWGAIDFAGGTVVHINAGIAGLVGALMVGKRVGYGREQMAPHSLTLTMVGAALLWFGWFGFNCGSNLEISSTAFVAMINTFVCTAAAGISWMLIEWLVKGRPSLLGLASGVVAGLVAVTPAAGFSGPMGAIVLGLVAGVICFFACTGVKRLLNYDDSLDVFGVHGVGGIVGAIATGILVSPDLGGSGLADYVSKPGELVAGSYDMATQVFIQAKAVGFTILFSGILSAILFKIVDILVGLRPGAESERQGLDLVDHGERAYNH
ncbi:ammonium transporter [uncultured Hyphomicrobium sp.]|jgi:Amt family ammonium transporter|uniref:ammonium transporter n=1 Tax=uncultured Hyphomicrobium sp. TaxID=194373 RepID=UPI0025E65D30|nr:ammonium transporter [uncultured Hyphomicrobium sp.]